MSKSKILYNVDENKNVGCGFYLINKINIVLVEFTDFLQRFIIFGVDKQQVLGKEYVDDVGPVPLVDGDPTVPLLLDLGNLDSTF